MRSLRYAARFAPGLVLLTALATLPATAQPAVWKIDTLLPITGRYASYAIEFRLGMEIARDEINAKGGVLGRKIDLTIQDTQSSPAQVASLIRRACSGALLVAGPATSSESQVAFPVANSMSCLAISGTASAAGLTAHNRPWTFTYSAPASVTAPDAVRLLVGKLHPKTAVIVLERSDPAATSMGENAAETLKQKGIETTVLDAGGKDVDYGPIVTRLTGLHPDLVVISTLDQAAVGLLKEMRSTGARAAVLLTQSAFTPLVAQAGADMLEGAYRYTEYDARFSDPRIQQFTKAFERLNDGREPTQLAAESYDLIYLIKYAIENGKLNGTPEGRTGDRMKLMEIFSHLTNWPSISGPLTMSPEGYGIKPVFVLRFHDGKWQLVNG